MKTLKEPTLLQRRLFMEMRNSKNKTMRQAATAAGFSPNTPLAKIEHALSLTTLRTELEKLDATPEFMAQRIADGQDALKLHLSGDGEEHWAPDWAARYRYDTLVLRMFGVPVTGTLPAAEAPATHVNVFNTVVQYMQKSVDAMREINTPQEVVVE